MSRPRYRRICASPTRSLHLKLLLATNDKHPSIQKITSTNKIGISKRWCFLHKFICYYFSSFGSSRFLSCSTLRTTLDLLSLICEGTSTTLSALLGLFPSFNSEGDSVDLGSHLSSQRVSTTVVSWLILDSKSDSFWVCVSNCKKQWSI